MSPCYALSALVGRALTQPAPLAGRGDAGADEAASSSDDDDGALGGDALPRPLPDPNPDPAGTAPTRLGADGLWGDPDGPGGGTRTLEYERRDAGGAPVPLEPALVTLALLPRSQWQSLVHLDAIKVRAPIILPWYSFTLP